jgi:TolB protein
VAPTWSPDGKRIAFVSDRTGTPQIYVMERDGTQPKRITYSGSHFGDPDWSPKGDQIAFTGRDEKGVFQIFVGDAQGKSVRAVTSGAYDTMDPSWSPDGRFLAVSSRRQGKNAIYLFRLGSQDFRRVSPAGEEASQPAWSPRPAGS